jgi:hypothetical protein
LVTTQLFDVNKSVLLASLSSSLQDDTTNRATKAKKREKYFFIIFIKVRRLKNRNPEIIPQFDVPYSIR